MEGAHKKVRKRDTRSRSILSRSRVTKFGAEMRIQRSAGSQAPDPGWKLHTLELGSCGLSAAKSDLWLSPGAARPASIKNCHNTHAPKETGMRRHKTILLPARGIVLDWNSLEPIHEAHM